MRTYEDELFGSHFELEFFSLFGWVGLGWANWLAGGQLNKQTSGVRVFIFGIQQQELTVTPKVAFSWRSPI